MLLISLWFLKGYSQVKDAGVPGIQNYPRAVYNAGTQNWSIAQDRRGFIYYANNEGILRFDGIHWDLFRISQTSPVRSVYIDSHDQIFAGSYNDFGKLNHCPQGNMTFESLRHLIPNDTIQFADIWKIHQLDNLIIFQSFEYLFVYDGSSIDIVRPQNRFMLSFQAGNQFFVQEPGIGVFEYTNGSIEEAGWSSGLSDGEISAMVEFPHGQLLVGTSRDGIFRVNNGSLQKWDTPANQMVEELKLYSAVKISDEFIAFGTILSGVIIADTAGNVVQHINMGRGLQNNTVLSMFADKDKNLWLGLDNGIDHVEINSPLTFFSGKEGPGAGYSAVVFNGGLYLGTNQGLFYKPFKLLNGQNDDFHLVENTTGQVWSLEVHDGQLLCGHHTGIFRIEKDEAVKIGNDNGYWGFIPLNNYPELLIGGTYTGLILLKKGEQNWEFARRIKGFSESSRFLAEDKDGNIWMSHGMKGVFRLRLNEELDSVVSSRLYTHRHGLPSSENNLLFQFRNKEYVATINGIYHYNAESDTFMADEGMNTLFAVNSRLRTIEVDNNQNIWFIAEDESGVLRLNEDMTYTKITAPFEALKNKFINGFEFIYPLSDEHVFFGIENGFAHYSSMFSKTYHQPFGAYVMKVELPYIDSVVYVQENASRQPEFVYNNNSFRFHYTAPFYENPGGLRFSYMLENYNPNWSDWSTDHYKDYTNLPEGNYVFKVKARNVFGTESIITEYPFRIRPPWFRTRLALYMYLFMLTGLIILTAKFILFRMELAKTKVFNQHHAELVAREEMFRLEKVMAEKELIKLKNEKLTGEMVFRDKELANQTMSIIQKNKFLSSIKEELQSLQKSLPDESLKKKISILSRNINKEIDNKQQNQLFESYFDDVHKEFFTALKEQYPDLSPREMRLSAYIRMNLTSKEIAALLNITDRGVEIGRYRLRRKLGLARDVNLSIFLSNI